jgi:polyhydroxybutyrate depolymerase
VDLVASRTLYRFVRILVALASSLAIGKASPVYAGCDGAPGPTGTVELKIGAATRTFVVRVPSAVDPHKPAPVVFLFHPFGMNSQYMQGRVPIPRIWPEAIAVYPQAMPRAGGGAGFQPAWQTAAGEMDDRDLVFFDQMLVWMRANHCVDDSRVSVMGYSNGARLASLLACERSAAIAGVAIQSGSLSCEPPAARSIVLNHGLHDATIPYARAVEASKAWASRNGCAAPPKTGALGCFAADSCSSAPVTLCTYDGGHEYDEPFTRVVADFLKKAILPKR